MLLFGYLEGITSQTCEEEGEAEHISSLQTSAVLGAAECHRKEQNKCRRTAEVPQRTRAKKR